jgi:tRNA modification GTPase
MPSLPQDTIVALATAAGPGARAIVRLSGPGSAAAVRAVFSPAEQVPPPRNRFVSGQVSLPGVSSHLPADLYFWHAPNSYTGQDMAELHTLSCMPLVELLVSALLAAGCRAAQPGEFTMRAFLSGKLDLTRAEAVHAIIEASSRAELQGALAQLAGGMARPLGELRDDLLNLLADVEAGLDFADEDIHFVDQQELLTRLSKALAQVTLVSKQLDSRAVAGAAFSVVLAGRPNAGKSSLFNALAGGSALVSDIPGTTRDYLVSSLSIGGTTAEIVDTPGWQATLDLIGGQAQSLSREQQRLADLVILCVESGEREASAPGEEYTTEEKALLSQSSPPVLRVATKCDLHSAAVGWLPTSALTGAGLAALRRELEQRARARQQPALAPSISRCKHHVAACLEHLRRAHATVLYEDPPEILALELRETLEQLGEMVGAVYTEDLLDRIFSRFCIGK